MPVIAFGLASQTLPALRPPFVLERLFKLREHGTSVSVELRAGTVTFLAMAYIIFVQPAVLSRTGMDFGGVMVATCLSAAAATLVMALLANYELRPRRIVRGRVGKTGEVFRWANWPQVPQRPRLEAEALSGERSAERCSPWRL